ncbi:MAG: glycosyltransferase family 4 protein [Armatimonadota bacterium]
MAGSEGRAPRVLLANHVAEISGAENSLLTLARHLSPRRWQVAAAVPPGPLASELAGLGVPVSLMPELRLARPRGAWQAAVAYLRLRRWATTLEVAAQELGCDLVAANSLTAGLAASIGVGRRLPLVWHARDLRAPERSLRWLIPRATRIAAISACVADALIDAHKAARERTVVVYNGVDTTLFRPGRAREQIRHELGIAADALVIGNVGQLVPWKRQDLFVEAAARIIARVPHVRFLIVGADLFGEHAGYVRELRALVRSLNLGERVVFTGFREDIASVMSAMDLLVHCAENEPLGRAVMEAMSLGVPCIAPDACGPAEIIEDGVSGVLVPPGDVKAMATRAAELLRRPSAIERMGAAARRRISETFSAERMARLTEDLYEEALAHGSHGR